VKGTAANGFVAIALLSDAIARLTTGSVERKIKLIP
jgi:hypothetical protein